MTIHDTASKVYNYKGICQWTTYELAVCIEIHVCILMNNTDIYMYGKYM